MKIKTLALGAVAAAMMAAPSIAEAAWAKTTGSVNLRTGPSAGYEKITTLPAYATIFVDGQQNGWYHVNFNGYTGFVSGLYVDTPMAMAPRGPMFRDRGPGPGFYIKGQAPQYGYHKKPYWDNQHQAWYDGRRWYRNGVWYNSPQGFSFGFSFGG